MPTATSFYCCECGDGPNAVTGGVCGGCGHQGCSNCTFDSLALSPGQQPIIDINEQTGDIHQHLVGDVGLLSGRRPAPEVDPNPHSGSGQLPSSRGEPTDGDLVWFCSECGDGPHRLVINVACIECGTLKGLDHSDTAD